ncbi:MAG: ribosome-associated translation inhibitor RaiA [Desulfobacterales bacterium]|nr:ribosome-associated translation inhibitor RaiA [Desulfobacterales bacterium]
MQTAVTFKNIDPSDHLKTYLQEKLNRLDKFLDNPAEANAVLSVEKFRHIAEVNISGDRLNIIGKEETDDMYSAIDMVLDKLGKQIKKSKQKIRERRPGVTSRARTYLEGEETHSEDDIGRQVRVQNIEYKPMDIEEAIMQIDISNKDFLVFTNARSEQVNVIYRRKDGDYGLIQPSA